MKTIELSVDVKFLSPEARKLYGDSYPKKMIYGGSAKDNRVMGMQFRHPYATNGEKFDVVSEQRGERTTRFKFTAMIRAGDEDLWIEKLVRIFPHDNIESVLKNKLARFNMESVSVVSQDELESDGTANAVSEKTKEDLMYERAMQRQAKQNSVPKSVPAPVSAPAKLETSKVDEKRDEAVEVVRPNVWSKHLKTLDDESTANAKAEFESVQTALDDANKRLASANAERESVQTALDAAKEELSKLAAAKEELVKIAAAKDAELLKMSKQISAAKEKEMTLEAELAAAKDELAKEELDKLDAAAAKEELLSWSDRSRAFFPSSPQSTGSRGSCYSFISDEKLDALVDTICQKFKVPHTNFVSLKTVLKNA
jgi:hypothetical protein